MSKQPTIGKFLDHEEEELFNAIESDAYVFGKSTLTPKRKSELQTAARARKGDASLYREKGKRRGRKGREEKMTLPFIAPFIPSSALRAPSPTEVAGEG